jgi:hypothetical protein
MIGRVVQNSSGLIQSRVITLSPERMGLHNSACEFGHEPALKILDNWMFHEIMTRSMFAINPMP